LIKEGIEMPRGKHKTVTKKKAREILRHGKVHGKPLTKKQRGFMGARAGGQPVRRKTAGKSRKRR